jgi:hypothetical protein
MAQRIKLFTHEAIIHSQVCALEKTLSREIDYELLLNSRESRSHIQFDADEKEIMLIKGNLGYTVMIQDGTHWLPHI